MSGDRVRVLLVDDSATALAALRTALSDDLEIVGEAADGTKASRLVGSLAPDVVTMDVFLRRESGIEVAASIMRSKPTPIVIVTAADPRDPSLVFRALEAGVLDVCAKLPAPTHPDYEQRRSLLKRTLRALAKVPVVHRDKTRRMCADTVVSPPAPPVPKSRTTVASGVRQPIGTNGFDSTLLVIGASTGGPPVLASVLRRLRDCSALSIVIVQHMMAAFTNGFAQWLKDESDHSVSVVSSRTRLSAGAVFLPAAERHVVIESDGYLVPSEAPPLAFHRPSIDVLFGSVAVLPRAARTVAVLLTGMGRDGAAGLLALRTAGARTIVQSPDTCAVSSMPEQAIRLGAAEHIVPADDLASAIATCMRP